MCWRQEINLKTREKKKAMSCEKLRWRALPFRNISPLVDSSSETCALRPPRSTQNVPLRVVLAPNLQSYAKLPRCWPIGRTVALCPPRRLFLLTVLSLISSTGEVSPPWAPKHEQLPFLPCGGRPPGITGTQFRPVPSFGSLANQMSLCGKIQSKNSSFTP